MSSASGFIKPCCLDFGENIVNFDVEREDSQLFITCRLYTFNSNTQKFEQSATKVANSRICLHRDEEEGSVQCEIADCRTLKLAETQQSFPFVLLKTRYTGKVRQTTLRLFGLTVAGTRWAFSSLDDPLTVDDERTLDWGPKLAHGPSVAWVVQGEFRIKRYRPSAGVKSSWRITLGGFRRVIVAKLDFDWFPSQNLCGMLLLAVQSQTMSLVQKIRLSPLHGEELATLDNFECGPDLHDFLSKSTCSQFIYKTHSEENDGIMLATSSGQLLQFDSYKMPVISHSCKLPVNDATDFRFYRNLLPAEEYCIVDSKAGKSCVINLASFQVVSSPSMPQAVGFSYIHNGYLFRSLSDRHTPFVMTLFEIKDLAGCLRPEGDAGRTASGLSSALKALHSRVMAGKIAVSSALSESNSLKKTTNELAHMFRRITIGEQNLEKGHKPYVYGLLTGKQVSVIRNMSKDLEPHHCRSLDIGTPWQRTVGDVRVIGVDVTNYTENRIFDLHLVVTVPFCSIQHSTKFVSIDEKYKAESQSAAPPAKKLCLDNDTKSATGSDVRSLEPGQSAMLTVAISLKLLGHRSQLTFNVAVASKREDGAKVTSSCIGCLPVTVAMQDVLNKESPNFNTESKGQDALHDLAALNAYTDTLEKLVIISKETDLTVILDILQRRANLSLHPYLDILVWQSAQQHGLWNAWIVLDNKSPFKVHLTIHARNRWQFFEVVHYLYGKLPADILILPDDGKPLQTLPASLLEEASLVSSYLGNVPGADDRSQSRSFACSPVNLDLDGYHNFRNKLYELEHKTDNIAATVLASKNLLRP